MAERAAQARVMAILHAFADAARAQPGGEIPACGDRANLIATDRR